MFYYLCCWINKLFYLLRLYLDVVAVLPEAGRNNVVDGVEGVRQLDLLARDLEKARQVVSCKIIPLRLRTTLFLNTKLSYLGYFGLCALQLLLLNCLQCIKSFY